MYPCCLLLLISSYNLNILSYIFSAPSRLLNCSILGNQCQPLLPGLCFRLILTFLTYNFQYKDQSNLCLHNTRGLLAEMYNTIQRSPRCLNPQHKLVTHIGCIPLPVTLCVDPGRFQWISMLSLYINFPNIFFYTVDMDLSFRECLNVCKHGLRK